MISIALREPIRPMVASIGQSPDIDCRAEPCRGCGMSTSSPPDFVFPSQQSTVPGADFNSSNLQEHPMNLDNSVVLVTGATGGLGRQFVAQALARGASKVYAGARRDHDWNDSRVVPLALDVTDSAAIAAAAAAAADTTVLVNNAGTTGASSLL